MERGLWKPGRPRCENSGEGGGEMKKRIYSSLQREVIKEMRSQEGVVWEERDQLLDKPHEWQGNALRVREKWGGNWEVEDRT